MRRNEAWRHIHTGISEKECEKGAEEEEEIVCLVGEHI